MSYLFRLLNAYKEYKESDDYESEIYTLKQGKCERGNNIYISATSKWEIICFVFRFRHQLVLMSNTKL